MSPGFIGTVASIEMVIFCAVGGRGSLLGAVFGALIVNAAKSRISESFPELWTIAMGMLFIGVVLVFPKGLAGIYQQHVQPRLAKYIPGKTARKSWNKSKANSGAAK
ncbi:ABC transporter permease [Klebsiella michiganensis]|nr:hypothetical protein [Klebsiella michiganensis]